MKRIFRRMGFPSPLLVLATSNGQCKWFHRGTIVGVGQRRWQIEFIKKNEKSNRVKWSRIFWANDHCCRSNTVQIKDQRHRSWIYNIWSDNGYTWMTMAKHGHSGVARILRTQKVQVLRAKFKVWKKKCWFFLLDVRTKRGILLCCISLYNLFISCRVVTG